MDTIKLKMEVVKLTAAELRQRTDWFVEFGRGFEADEFAEHQDVNYHDLDAADVHAAQDKAAQLNAGEWLLVEVATA